MSGNTVGLNPGLPGVAPEKEGNGRRKRIVVAITGASGAPYAVRLLQALRLSGAEVHLTLSQSGVAVIGQELGLKVDVRRPNLDALLTCVPPWSDGPAFELDSPLGEKGDERFFFHQFDDYMTPIASGSFMTDAMVICPCSGSTLSGVSRASASNLIERAAEVHLKEHRKLVIVPRETPMSVLQIENMHRLAQAGAVLLPAMPGWYHDVKRLEDLVDFVVARILDQIGVENRLIQRWKETT